MQASFELSPLTLTPNEQRAHDLAKARANNHRLSQAELIESIEEVDRLRLFEKLRLTSTTAYCRKHLLLGGPVASNLLNIAKKTRTIDGFLDAIREGEICVTAARKICPVLTPENKEEWFEKARTLTLFELEREVAKVSPHAVNKDRVKPVGPDRNHLSYEVSDRVLEVRERVRELESLRLGRTPTATEIELAMGAAYLEKYDPLRKAERARKRKSAAKPATKNGKRTAPPAYVVHEVNKRDQGACAVVVNGRRCGSTRFVDLHHIVEVSMGGEHTVENMITVCSAHHRQIHEDQEFTV